MNVSNILEKWLQWCRVNSPPGLRNFQTSTTVDPFTKDVVVAFQAKFSNLALEAWKNPDLYNLLNSQERNRLAYARQGAPKRQQILYAIKIEQNVCCILKEQQGHANLSLCEKATGNNASLVTLDKITCNSCLTRLQTGFNVPVEGNSGESDEDDESVIRFSLLELE